MYGIDYGYKGATLSASLTLFVDVLMTALAVIILLAVVWAVIKGRRVSKVTVRAMLLSKCSSLQTSAGGRNWNEYDQYTGEFKDLETGRLFTLSLNRDTFEEIKEGRTGVLTYRKNRALSFRQGSTIR